MRRYISEFVGTYFLVFTVGATVLGKVSLAPLAIGAVLMVMVYAGGHVSGAHYNPAVTVAVLLRRRITARDAAGYVLAQGAGAIVGALTARWVVHPAEVQALHLTGHDVPAALAAEALFTFALAFVVLNVATSRSHPDNSFYGLAIGFTVLSGAVAVGGISGGAFNPAVVLGGALMGLLSWSTIWVHLAAEIVGAAAAAGLFLALNPDDRGATPLPPPGAVTPPGAGLVDSATTTT